jgi:hypothetical protein
MIGKFLRHKIELTDLNISCGYYYYLVVGKTLASPHANTPSLENKSESFLPSSGKFLPVPILIIFSFFFFF